MILDKRDIRNYQQKYRYIGGMSILEWFGMVWADGGISSLAKKGKRLGKGVGYGSDD